MAEELYICGCPCIRFGCGERHLVIVPGVSLTSLAGKGALIAGSYALLAKDFTCTLIDRRSEMPEGYTIHQMAGDVLAVMGELGIGQASFFGVSQGGQILLDLAAHHPEVMEQMVLGSTAAMLSEDTKVLFREWKSLALAHDVPGLNDSFQNHVFSEGYRAKYEKAFALLRNVGTPADCDRFAILCEACLGFDVTDALASVTVPAFVIGSVDDHVFPGKVYSRPLAEALDCPLYLYEGFGHAVYDEAPDYRERLHGFLAE